MVLDWDHIELVGWYDHQGRAYLIPLERDGTHISVIVTGVREAEIPLLDIPAPSQARLHMVPEDRNPFEYAKELGGFYAVGFYMQEGVRRGRDKGVP